MAVREKKSTCQQVVELVGGLVLLVITLGVAYLAFHHADWARNGKLDEELSQEIAYKKAQDALHEPKRLERIKQIEEQDRVSKIKYVLGFAFLAFLVCRYVSTFAIYLQVRRQKEHQAHLDMRRMIRSMSGM